MQVREFMTTDVETVHEADEVGEVLGRLARVNFSGFPVLDDEGAVVGVVTEGDLVDLFRVEDRVLWIPVGLPPFVDTLTYAVDVSWEELDLGLDLARHVDDPVRDVMSADPVTISPDASLDEALALLGDPERDINRLPVVAADGSLVGIVARQDAIRAVTEDQGAGTSP